MPANSKTRKALIALPFIFLSACASPPRVPPKTQLQIRQMQTRAYDTKDLKLVMKALLNVLQDDDYIVKQVNLDLGFLNATQEIDLGGSRGNPGFFIDMFGLAYQPTWESNAIIDCTANVSDFGAQTRVRVNFQSKVLDNRGGIVQVHTIDDEKFYQQFFTKLDKAIFLQKEKL